MGASGIRTAQDLAPEGVLLVGALLCAGLSVIRPRLELRVFAGIAGLTLVAAALTSLVVLRGMPAAGYAAYSDGLTIDRFTVFLTPLLCTAALFTVAAGQHLGPRLRPHVGEYHALVLMATLGAVLLVAAQEMVELWVALELLSVASVAIVALAKTDPGPPRAALRLLLIGGAGSAAILYGMALLYGLTGTTVLTQVAASLSHSSPALALCSGLIVAGVVIKLGGAAPGRWAGDLAADAPAPVVGLLASLGLIAGTGSLARLVVVALPAASSTWTAAVAAVAVAAAAGGTLVAVRERRMRRLLVAVGAAQGGLVLAGLLAWHPDQQGVGAVLVALVVGGVTLAAAFAAVAGAEAAGVGDFVTDYRGLSRRAPVPAALLVVGLLSLAGSPPLIGFVSRILILQAITSAGYAWMLVVLVPASLIGVVVALRVAVVLVVDAPAEDASRLEEGMGVRAALAAVTAATVVLGVAAQPLLALAVGGAGQLH